MSFSENILFASENRKDPPNVILILADDMALGDLSFINEGITQTPNLDQLAKESVWFNNGYSAAPVCAPARASLLTGKYPHQTGCVTLNLQRFPQLTRISRDLYTIADAFQDNGYATGLIGKWHCGEGPGYHPLDRGFREFEGFVGYMVNTYFDYKLDINREIKEFKDSYLTQDLSERAIDFLKRHKDHPFFLHLAHYAPHRPLNAPQEVVDSYLSKGFDENTAIIYAMIEIMDEGIGKLLQALDELELRERTIVIFSSDNGPDPLPGTRHNENLRGTKYTVYEGGIHVPFIINWENTLKPGERDAIIHFTDIFPTLIDICNLKLYHNTHLEGINLTPVLLNPTTDDMSEYRFWQWNRGVPEYSHNAAVRNGKWKLVRPYVTRNFPEGESTLKPVLYDLENDPFEQEDVSGENQKIYETMSVILERWSRRVELERLINSD